MLSLIGKWGYEKAAQLDPWTNVYGVARSILALSTTITLICSPAAVLFRIGPRTPLVPCCGGVRSMGLFCVATSAHLELARFGAIIGLLLVVSGWRPRWTGLLHFWLAFSLQANASVLEGGDHIAAVLSLLLIPICHTDPRRWHWLRMDRAQLHEISAASRMTAWLAFTAIRVQIAIVYFHAAIGKFAVEEWADGTALYYYFNNSMLGAGEWVRPLINSLIMHPVILTVLTWSVLALEYLLSAALWADRKYWRGFLIAGCLLHTGIMLVHGLFAFSLAMFSALILYLQPVEVAFALSPRRALRWLWAGLSSSAAASPAP